MPEFRLKLTPKQDYMIRELASVDEILWGGQAGGGKSEGLLMFCLYRRLTCPGSAGLMLRRTFPELEKSLIRKSLKYFSNLGKYTDKHWKFPNGSVIDFGYCADEKDVYQYQSAEYDDICFDELTHFTEFQYLYMLSRLRSATSGRGWKCVVRSASNPGNIGHQWVKSRFVDVARNEIYKDDTEKTRYFLPASLDDNTLMTPQERSEYRIWLRNLPEYDRQMLEAGNWDFVPNAVFSELRREIHGIDPKEPPERLHDLFDFKAMLPHKELHVFRFGDWGFARPFAYYWAFSDFEGRIYIFKELYGCKPDEANVGIKLITREQAIRIKQYEDETKVTPILKVIDSSIYDKPQSQDRKAEQLPSDAEIMASEGVYWDEEISKRVKKSRLQGVQQLHDRFSLDDKGLPGLFIFTNCVNWWRTVPILQPDPIDPDLYDSDMEDHAADATRYLCSARPWKSVIKKPVPKPFSVQWYYNRQEARNNAYR